MDIKQKVLEWLYISAAVIGSDYSKQYQGVMENIVHDYANDVALPIIGYFSGKWATEITDYYFNQDSFSPVRNAAFMFVGCCAFEVAQGLHLYQGTFDPYDFVAYAAGAGLALGVDRLTSGKKSLDELVVK